MKAPNIVRDTAFILAVLTSWLFVIGIFYLAGLLNFFNLELSSFITNSIQISTAAISVIGTVLGQLIKPLVIILLTDALLIFTIEALQLRVPKPYKSIVHWFSFQVQLGAIKSLSFMLLGCIIMIVLSAHEAYQEGRAEAVKIITQQLGLYYKITNGQVDQSEGFISIMCGTSTCAYWSYQKKAVVLFKSDQEFLVKPKLSH